MADPAQLPLWPDTVEAFYADRACSIRSVATRRSWGYTYRRLQRLHPDTAIGGFRTGELHRLRWRHVSLNADMIEVVGKADKPATVATTPQLQEQLQQWRNNLGDLDGSRPEAPVVPCLASPIGTRPACSSVVPHRR